MMEYRITKWLNTVPVVSLFVLLILGGCYYDNEECLYPEGNTTCDTMDISYSVHVWPVINDNCIACHSGGTPSGNVSLENYDDIRTAALIPAGNYGSLYGVISHAPGNSPMPKNAGKLPECTIKQIKTWIDQGAPEN